MNGHGPVPLETGVENLILVGYIERKDDTLSKQAIRLRTLEL